MRRTTESILKFRNTLPRHRDRLRRLGQLGPFALVACLPSPPDLDGAPALPDLGGIRDTWSDDDLPEWPEDDPGFPEEDGPNAQGESGGSDGAGGPSGDADGGELFDPGLASLRITEVCADPDGKDGAAEGPEWIEVSNPSVSSVALGGLLVEATSWPTLDTEDLGLDGEHLEPGQSLTIFRFGSDATQPDLESLIAPDSIAVSFTSSGGLRNADGGVLLGLPDGTVADLLVYGELQAAPYDDPEDWTGNAATTANSKQSLCRADASSDTDGAADWQSCVPSPGQSESDPEEEGADDGEMPPDVAQTGAIVITEVFANPPGPANEDKFREFVEVLNDDDEAIDLAQFTIADAPDANAPGTDPLVYLAGDGGCMPVTCLAPGKTAILVGNAYDGDVGDALVLATDDTTLADGGLTNKEPAVLRDGEGALVSSYRVWEDPSSEPNPDGSDLAVKRQNSKEPDEPGSWALGAADPGV